MKISEIIAFLQKKAPFETAEAWDNSGLLVGSPDAETAAVVIALDITDDVIDAAVNRNAKLIVSHHPVIFEPIRALTAHSIPYRLASEGVAALCVHTNLDKAAGGVNDCLAKRLGLRNVRVAADGMSRLGELPEAVTAAAFAALVADTLHTAVRARTGGDAVRTVALCGGAGADLVLPLLGEADAALTGEVKHHEWLAVPQGKTLVDAGHFPTEIAVVDQLAAWLREAFPSLTVTVHRGDTPYDTIKD